MDSNSQSKPDAYSIPIEYWQVELEVKRSKFLTILNHASDRASAEAFIRHQRDMHPQANHVCWAYIAGPPNTTIRSMSDDGEPSGTAGMPMLKILEHSGLGETVVAVVRYFGGTKLGTGGLQRAYSDAVALGLKTLPTELKVPKENLILTYDYCYEGGISRLLGRYSGEIIQSEYQSQVQVTVAIPCQTMSEIKQQLVDLCSGNISITKP